MKFLALFLSTLFEPSLIFFLILLTQSFGLSDRQWLHYASVILSFTLLTFVSRFYLVKKLRTNWDISDQKLRVQSLGYLLGIVVLLFIILLQFHNETLTRFYIFMMVWFIGFTFISLKVKISGHVGALVLLYNFTSFLPLLFAIPLIAWSRWYLKRHTIVEIIGGLVYSELLYEIWIRIFG